VELSANFLHLAKNVGKTIISELFIENNEDRLVKPATDRLGGIAGLFFSVLVCDLSPV
jgi:hypothetical protein